MALVDISKTQRYELPHEPGAWIEMRPASSGDLANTGSDPYTVTLQVLGKVIVAWSYDAPVTSANVYLLDMETVQFLAGAFKELSGIRSDEEKNALSSPSSATLA